MGLLAALVAITVAQPTDVYEAYSLGANVQIAVASNGAFRVSVKQANASGPIVQMENPMMAPQDAGSLPKATTVTDGGMSGLKTAFGSALFDATTGEFVLRDADGNNLTYAAKLFDFATTNKASNASPPPSTPRQSIPTGRELLRSRIAAALAELTADEVATGACANGTAGRTDCKVDGEGPCRSAGCCWAPVNPNPANLPWCFHQTGPPPPPTPPPPPGKCVDHPGMDIAGSAGSSSAFDLANEAACCSKCTATRSCQLFVFAAKGHESGGDNCWLLSGVSILKYATDRAVGYVRGPVPVMPPPPPPQSLITLGASASAKYYGGGAGGGTATTLSMTSSAPKVTNTAFYIPHYWSSDGYSALVASDLQYTPTDMKSYPAGWTSSDGSVQWTVEGGQFDVYLMPGDQRTALSAFWDLTGRPALPPRYAFGFMACRWGWKDYGYIAGMLNSFRNGSYPIDAFISDFEWFTIEPDYSLPPQGTPTYTDFGYNNVTFPSPVAQLTQYHDELNFKFGGIRKPRLGNSELLIMAHQNNWTVDADHSGGAPGGTRNLNYSIPALQEWYAEQHAHYLKDGVDFWWNDEGETFYFCFHWWNVAQMMGLAKFDPKKRFFTINRSYSPGMSRLGAVIWTGDISVSWDSLGQQPGYVLNWHMAGVGFVTCDSGGFNGNNDTPLLLTRWYQYAAFMPVMRVHSSINNLPHFPFLYGEAAGDAMRKALNMRYQLVPYHYSLAHAAYQTGQAGDGVPMMRPLLWSYPDDPVVAEMTQQWFDGPDIMIAPVLNDQNSSNVYLPAGTWYEWNTSTVHTGPIHLTAAEIALDHIPVYVRPGGIVTLGPVIQYTAQMPGGPLEVHIYTGIDGSFTLVEDDGETLDYQTGVARATTFSWSDITSTVSWTVTGAAAKCAQCYTTAVFTAISAAGRKEATGELGAGGKVKLVGGFLLV